MGIVTGQMSISRFRVTGAVPDGWRELFRERLNSYAFREPPNEMGLEEIEGWVQIQKLLDTDFSDFNQWLYGDYALFSLRLDRKRLPAQLFKATVQRECARWCEERDSEHCPAQVRTEIRDRIEQEWLRKTLPTVRVTEAAWSISGGWLILQSLSDATIERFRKRFFQTFGLRLIPWSPLDWLEDQQSIDAFIRSTPSSLVSHLDASSVHGRN